MTDARLWPQLASDDRAVSNVVGVVLVVAIVVILAAVVGILALGFGDSMGSPTPTFTVEANYQADGSGNDGNEVAWADVWTGGEEVTATDYVHIDGHGSDGALNAACSGETYSLIYRPGPESSQILQEIEIDRAATGPAATHC